MNIIDYGSIQDGVDVLAASTASQRSGRGAALRIPAGVWEIDEPIILPRTGTTPTSCVALVGDGPRHTLIRGSSKFPEGRALIEWEHTPTRAWEQHITGLTLGMPDAPGTKAIHYARVGTGTTLADFNAERMQLDLANVLIEGNNAFHDTAVHIEGQAFFSSFRRVALDCRRGTSQGSFPAWTDHQTVLFQFDDTHSGGIDNDISGLSYSQIVHCRAGVRRGGRHALFDGRAKGSRIEDGWVEGGRHRPGIYLRNSFNVIVDNTQNEGRAAPQIKVENSHGIDLIGVFPSTQNPESPEWKPNTRYEPGQAVIAPGWAHRAVGAPPANNDWYRLTSPGASGQAEPDWDQATVQDGTAVWERAGASVEDAIVIDNSEDVRLTLKSTGRKPTAAAKGVAVVRVTDSTHVSIDGTISGDPDSEIAWERSTGRVNLRDARNGRQYFTERH